MVRLILASFQLKGTERASRMADPESKSHRSRSFFVWTGNGFVQGTLLAFLSNFQKRCETVRNNLPLERIVRMSMVELLMLRADCSLVTLKPAHSSCYLPLGTGIF